MALAGAWRALAGGEAVRLGNGVEAGQHRCFEGEGLTLGVGRALLS